MVQLGNVFILGDSYSTFENHIPEGHAVWYFEGGKPEKTDVTKVEETWWHRVLFQTESTLVCNHSWSGTTVSNTGYDGPNTENSFIKRVDRLIADGYFEQHQIDTFFVFGGVNDIGSHAPIGDVMPSGWTEESLNSLRPAACYLLHKIKMAAPDARILYLTPAYVEENTAGSITAVCTAMNVEIVELGEFDVQEGHPNINGMQQIAQRILSHLNRK